MAEIKDDRTPPVKIGDVVDVRCINAAKRENTGVCRFEGFIVFVEGAKPGEVLSARITKVFEKFAAGVKA